MFQKGHMFSGVGARVQGCRVQGLQVSLKVLICHKFEQNLKKIGQRSFDIFNNTKEIRYFCYWVQFFNVF